jgi:hypothetical protein
MAPRELKRKLALQAGARRRSLSAECLFLLSGGSLNHADDASCRCFGTQPDLIFDAQGSVYPRALQPRLRQLHAGTRSFRSVPAGPPHVPGVAPAGSKKRPAGPWLQRAKANDQTPMTND